MTAKKNPIAASLRSKHLARRIVRARKGKGAFQRQPKHKGREA